jgi:methionine sulfoxide reductase heme-binding subunit
MSHRHWLAAIPIHISKIKVILLLGGLGPLAELMFEYYRNALGFDPLDRITRSTGFVALILLLISLTMTPLRHFLTWFMIRIHANHGKRVSDWNWIIKLRRMIGLLSFFYATTHLVIYFWLDQGADISDALSDMAERPFIAVGIIAFVLLVPLAVTANNYSMRLLKKNWRRLHRTVYVIAILAIIHYWMLTKVGVNDPFSYMLITAILLGWRAWYAWMPRKGKIPDHGMEMSERHSTKT